MGDAACFDPIKQNIFMVVSSNGSWGNKTVEECPTDYGIGNCHSVSTFDEWDELIDELRSNDRDCAIDLGHRCVASSHRAQTDSCRQLLQTATGCSPGNALKRNCQRTEFINDTWRDYRIPTFCTYCT